MHQILTYIRQKLSDHYPDSEAQAIGRLVLEKRFGISMLDICMGKDIQFSSNEQKEFDIIMDRLCNGEPVQYALGEAEFCDMTFGVAPGVLIPRPETEDLVEWIAGDYANAASGKMLDIGTGSGCIAISLKKKLERFDVTAWDISDEALKQAGDNARRLEADVLVEKMDVLKAQTDKRFDVIVSNPPYICDREAEDMNDNVLKHEPHLALFVPDADPLLFYRAIGKLGKTVLNNDGALYFEINRAYGKETKEMLEGLGYKDVELRKDRYDNDRMIKAIV